MSEEREGEQAGAPVEQTEATDTQLLAAVGRAVEVAPAAASPEGPAIGERPEIQPVSEPLSASDTQTAEEIFAEHSAQNGGGKNSTGSLERVLGVNESVSEVSAGAVAIAAEPAAPLEVTAADAAKTVSAPIGNAGLPPERDGEIRISADHPMAALYMQTPLAPTLKGNRGAGIFISLLATLVFALVYAGALAAWQAPHHSFSNFLEEGLLPWVLNWSFAAACAAFFIGLSLLVLVVGKAGWWAYVLGGFLVAVLVWAATVATDALIAQLAGDSVSWHPYWLATDFGLSLPVIAAAVVAREVPVWFGAWIGRRGRRVKRENAEALAEYEASLAESQAKTS